MWHHNGAHQKERVRTSERTRIQGSTSRREPGRRDHVCVPSAGGRRYSFPFRSKTGSARLIAFNRWTQVKVSYSYNVARIPTDTARVGCSKQAGRYTTGEGVIPRSNPQAYLAGTNHS